MSTPGGKRVVAIAAVARNGVIGAGPHIPWQVPGEQRHFRARTLGHTLLMGRTTYDSIGRPLPGRETIVLTRRSQWAVDGVHVAGSVDEALEIADGLLGEVFVAGGAEVYAALLPHVDEHLLSEIEAEPDGDAHYPRLDHTWVEHERTPHDGFQVVSWVRG